jgi:CheY-like chemotaxis protein
MKVLVVDDHPDSARIACILLTALSHDCREAMTGRAALAIAEELHPDMVILDIGLPDLSGYEVARELRRRYGRAMYLVALTGWGQPEDVARAIEAGFDKHVLKPADAALLQQLIAGAHHVSA